MFSRKITFELRNLQEIKLNNKQTKMECIKLVVSLDLSIVMSDNIFPISFNSEMHPVRITYNLIEMCQSNQQGVLRSKHDSQNIFKAL